MITSYSVAFTSSLHTVAVEHLLRTKGQEDLCFALWRPSTGATRKTALLYRLILPQHGERMLHGNASFVPEYFLRAVAEAMADEAGLAFIHSHIGPGWQNMSQDDIRAEQGHAGAVTGATGLPFVGLTLGTDGAWSARFWGQTGQNAFARYWCSHVRVIGDQLRVTYADHLMPPPTPKEELRRTVSAWGEEAQTTLARLRIGVVGAGSVGSIISEALARMGIQRVSLIDFDVVEELNRDRCLHASAEDAAKKRLKVDSLAKALNKSATADGFCVNKVAFSVTEEPGFRAALDCDVIFSCVDRPWGRCVLNYIAYVHLIPVVDGGIAVAADEFRGLLGADLKAHTICPGRRCLECLGQYDPGLVSVEKEGLLDNPDYIKGLPKNSLERRNENVFAFSLSVAAMELQQFLSMVIAPLDVSNVGQQTYHFVTGRFDQPEYEACNENCFYLTQIAQGDCSNINVTGTHPTAERLRKQLDHKRFKTN